MGHRKNSPSDVSESQGENFKAAAREIGCDEDEARFEEALRKIAKHKPPPDDSALKKPEKPKTKKPGD